MFKNVKKFLFVAVIALLCAFAFACSEDCPECETCTECVDPSADTCKDFCDVCGAEANKDNCKDYCDECPELNEDNCKDYCGSTECPTCPEQGFIAPTEFEVAPGFVTVGKTDKLWVDEESFVPENAYKGLLFSSSDESIATVDAEGNVYGVRPGEVVITVRSMLDPEVYQEADYTVQDALTVDYDIFQREKAYIESLMPLFAAENFTFPTPWSGAVTMKVVNTATNEEVTEFVVPEGLKGEVKLSYRIELTVNGAATPFTDSFPISIFAVESVSDNSVNRINKAVDCADTLLKEYTLGKLVDSDIILPDTIFGVSMGWTTSNSSVLTEDGEYIRPIDNKNVTLSISCSYLSNSTTGSFNVTVKGYSNEEKVEYILKEGALSKINNGSYNTSLVLPAIDTKFKADLTYKSLNTEIYGDDGVLVKAPTEATEVKFEVTVKYAVSKNNNFESTETITLTALPANTASVAAEEWLQASPYKNVTQFAYGKTESNVMDVPTSYTKGDDEYEIKWIVKDAVVAPKYLASEDVKTTNAFVLENGKPKLVVQYLRYQEAQIQAQFVNKKDSTDTATVNVFLNIGASTTPKAAYVGTWPSSDQGDNSLTIEQGLYDVLDNASHFDKSAGLTKRVYGWGFWSGVKITAPTFNGVDYEAFILDYMYWEVQDDGQEGVKINDLTLFNNGGDMGGNWGWLMYNASSKTIKLEVGVNGVSGTVYEEYKMECCSCVSQADADANGVCDSCDKCIDPNHTHADADSDGKCDICKLDMCTTSVGVRTSHAMDGYAVGFVTDASGKVLYGSGAADLGTANQGRVQYNIPNNRIKVGSDPLLIAESAKDTTVNYIEIPAGGYAMSWKYQFYNASYASLYAFNEPGTQLTIERFDVHPLNSQFAEYASEALVNAENALAEGATATTVESYVNRARLYYNQLTGLTKSEVFPAERLAAAELACAKLVDAEIEELLAGDKEGDDQFTDDPKFVVALGELNRRIEKYSDELKEAMAKKAEFDACYTKYSKVDLTITLDYNGGYATGLYGADDFDKLMPELMTDLYNWLIEKDAFHEKYDESTSSFVRDNNLTVPTLEEFLAKDYISSNFGSALGTTILSKYLFTPAKVTNAAGLWEDVPNYMGVIEGSDAFFNQPKYNKWITILDFVDEAARSGNYGGQDVWGRINENYSPSKYTDVVLDVYQGNPVVITNSGTNLGVLRFAQYYCGSINANAAYKNKIPADLYYAEFNRQDTQEKYGKIVYHCTDGAIELPKAPVKEGYVFEGWFFEDGSKAEITGALFKDVTVYARWIAGYENYVEEQVGTDLEGVYYGTGDEFRATTPTGTIADQAASVGLGKYAIVVGGKMFILPKFALIELGKEATEAITLSTKAELQVYGTDTSTQFSTGLIYDSETDQATPRNSFGHGALYQNTGSFDVTISDIINTYGRNIGGADFGYHRYHFTYDTEAEAYVGTNVGYTGTVVLKPGDFLWCPMTAERFCTGLTDCNGSNGVVGVLSDGVQAQFVDLSNFTLVSKEWVTVEFYDGEKVAKAQYLEMDGEISAPTFEPRPGFVFKGWGLTPDATEEDAVDIPTIPTESVKYYAIWEEFP